MKVAVFTDTYLPEINGVALTTAKFVEYLEHKGIEYKVFAPTNNKIRDSDFNDRIIRFVGVKFIFYPELKLALPRYGKISEELDKFGPDIIHVMTPMNMSYYGIRYAKKNLIPLVATYHTNFSDYLAYYNLKFLESTTWNFARWFHNKFDRNYCPSKATQQLLEANNINNFEVCNNGIDLEAFSSSYRSNEFREYHNFEDKLVFLYVGRMAPEKDIDVFINVAKNLNNKYKDKIHFLMVGDGPKKDELELNKPDNMTFTGYMKGRELSIAYASSDIFMFPSSTETYGNVILEAMASGLATIACSYGGILENIINGETGLLGRVKNEEDFYKAAEALILNEELRRRIANNGMNLAKSKEWEVVFDGLIKSYKKVIKIKKQETLVREKTT